MGGLSLNRLSSIGQSQTTMPYALVVKHISHPFNKIENGKAMRLDA